MEFIFYVGCLVLLVSCDTKSFWGMWGNMWYYDIVKLWIYAMAMQLNWYPRPWDWPGHYILFLTQVLGGQ